NYPLFPSGPQGFGRAFACKQRLTLGGRLRIMQTKALSAKEAPMHTPPDKERVRFPYISAEAFVSPTDKAALENLQRMPLLPLLVRKFNEIAADNLFYAQNAAESVRCGPDQ